MFESMMPTPNFRFPGVLNSQELLVAEAAQARAWAALDYDARTDTELEAEARDRLGRIILQLMSRGTDSISDLAAAAVAEFMATRPALPGDLTPSQQG
ncbi:hypothetical protein ARD30_19435 [Bosea thiooxidans]|jgi:hypothetical protein|uniref:Uncharacterized protein n=2 Tax=Bosea thiooxidans TaxID=53254 RepID=A0A0Q3I204_9HYPH|nr:hypothetical protein ARD30_19435 [Bosea thiooxidans]SKB77181.1 hypothetical protein SAMN05660750_02245 [Bosea thiooxidans]